MVGTAVSVCWNGHSREFTTVYKSLLENNVLVDCTVSAEGQSLKAHRLVLSACSPYFQRLFQEETGKHAFVILLDASFATLKAVIDFVYRGETQIPAENLKAFLTLARYLQIKGLDPVSDKNKNLSSNTTGNTPQKPFEDNQVTNTTQSISTSHWDRTQNSSQLHLHSDKYPDAVNTTSSVPVEGYSASREMVWFPQEYRKPPECTEVPLSTEGIVKHQPSNAVTTEKRKEVSNNVNSDECLSGNFFSEVDQGTACLFGHNIKIFNNVSSNTTGNIRPGPFEDNRDICTTEATTSERRKEILNNINSDEHMSGNFLSEADQGTTSIFGQQNLNQYSSWHESSHKNVESSKILPSQQLQMQLSDKVTYNDVVGQDEPLLPLVFVAASEQMDKECEEPMDDPEVLGNNVNERAEETEPELEQTLGQCSSWHESSHKNMESSKILPSQRLRMQLSDEVSSGEGVAGQDEPLVPLVLVSESEETDEDCEILVDYPEVLGNNINGRVEGTEPGLDGQNLDQCSSAESLPPENAQSLQLSGSRSPSRGALQSNALPLQPASQLHEGQRSRGVIVQQNSSEEPALAEVVRQAPSTLASQNRPRSKKKPCRCEICGRRFPAMRDVARHMNTHPAGCPYKCDVCGMAFTQPDSLALHKLGHTGERPYVCELCGRTFNAPGNLRCHRRTHTGERPYRCDVCGSAFAQSSTLNNHKRTHTGDRPHGCDVCGKSFNRPSLLATHKRKHGSDDTSL